VNPTVIDRGRVVVATLITLLLVIAGAVVTQPAHAAGPQVTVTPSADLDPAVDQTLTVSGTGFVGAGAAQGVYVLVGESSIWSGGRPLASDGWIAQAHVDDLEFVDGAWSTTLSIPAGSLDPAKSYQVATSAAHWLSATDRTMDTFTPISVRQPAPEPEPEPEPETPAEPEPEVPAEPEPETPVGPALTVSETEGLDPEGASLTVTASHFDGTAASRHSAGKAGFYIQVGWLSASWRPSEGAASSARSNAYSTWVADAANTFAPTKWTENADGTVSASWTVEVDEATLAAKRLDGGTLAVFTTGGGGVVQAGNEHAVAISFADAAPEPGTPEPGTPTEPGTPGTPTNPGIPTTPGLPATPTQPAPEPAAGGSLRWAVSSAFARYVTGPIASGSIAVSGGATQAGGRYQFGQADGSTFDPATGVGSVGYRGAVRFTGHNGILDVTVADPQLRVTGRDTAALYVTSGGASVHLADVDLRRAVRTQIGQTVTFADAPTTLTADGRARVFGGNATTLDPLTVTIGSPALAPSGGTGTVAAAAPSPEVRSIPATAPTSDGIQLDAATRAALEAGEPVTVSAGGFGAGETGIAVVVYSTPVLLDTVTADADGIATWTGSLPATLPDGAHTLTFQGSVDRGVSFTLTRAASTAEGACVVSGADLRWGYKESFRVYIEGIAAGGWELTDVAYDYPQFVWEGGEGSLAADAGAGLVGFGGSIRFTGHDGALDTTLSDARIELAGDTGYLVFDIAGTTQDGAAVAETGVRLAEFAVPADAVQDGAFVLDAVPAALTAAGSAAFGSYPAGEELDPVSATLPMADGCDAPAAAPTVAEEAAAAGGPEETAMIAADADAPAPAWPWIAGGAAALVLAAAVILVLARRRRAPVAHDVDS
jgi:hypothetical protein